MANNGALIPMVESSVFDFMKQKHHEKYDEYTEYKMLIGLLNDFIQFVQSSIESIRVTKTSPPKITVAYALARKPYQDTLHYFERLLINKDNFIEDFIEKTSILDNKN